MKDRQFVVETKIIDEANRIIEIVGASEAYDRVGDKMFLAGCKLDNYLRNPVILRHHDRHLQAIAKALSVKVVGTNMIFKIQFAETEDGKEWFYLYANRYMNAASIGFEPIKFAPNMKGGYDFVEWELLELSLVTVPCNPEAVQRAYKEGYISKSLYKIIKEDGELKMKEELQEILRAELAPVMERIKALEEEKAAETLKVTNLTEKFKTKAGAALSQANAKKLAEICVGLKSQADSLDKCIKEMSGEIEEMAPEGDDKTKSLDKKTDEDDFTEEDVMKLVQQNIQKIMQGVK